MHDGVATETGCLLKASRGASVVRECIPIVTLFPRVEDAVTTDRCSCNELLLCGADWGTSVSRNSVSVITLFVIDLIDDAVTTARKGAIGATGIRKDIGIAVSIVALLGKAADSITTRGKNALIGAAIRIGPVSVITFLTRFGNTVATDITGNTVTVGTDAPNTRRQISAGILRTGGAGVGAGVIVDTVRIVTVLTHFGDAIAAFGRNSADGGHSLADVAALNLTGIRAAVSGLRVAIIAGFGCDNLAITADWGTDTGTSRASEATFDLAGTGAAIIPAIVAVVTGFTEFDGAIAADSYCRRRWWWA